jgi:hypothetical protein
MEMPFDYLADMRVQCVFRGYCGLNCLHRAGV